jgi:Inner membrane protein YgaP-like, transmembrane domain
MSFMNLAGWDRILRLVLGGLMLYAGWSGLVGGVWGVALEIFGWVPVATGIAGWCPAYAILGVSTRKRGAAPRRP